MKYIDFLNLVSSFRPSREELIEYGLDEAEIEDIRGTFSVTTRPLVGDVGGDEVSKMILKNDCSQLAIGLLRFVVRPIEHSKGKIVAYCEADPVIVRWDGVIVMCDHAGGVDVDIECARDSEKFLDAIGKFAEIRKNKLQWKGRFDDAVEISAGLAGNINSRDFYKILCGFLV